MIKINGKSLTIDQLIRVARSNEKIELSSGSKSAIQASRKLIEEKAASDDVVYSINTGFGSFSSVVISKDKLRDLQMNIVRSHAVGVGPLLEPEVVRAMMLLRINTLARGNSGVRVLLVETFIKMLNADILPIVPSQGSVGASGDLAPLSHIALGVIGEGECFYKGKRMSTKSALVKAKIKPLNLEAKEGLALINGTQLMTSIGALAVHDAENLVKHVDLAAAISTDVTKGTMEHTDPLIHSVRPFAGQAESAVNIRILLKGSKIMDSHKNCGKVQDAYSFRCAPQVHGATRDTIRYVRSVLEIEMNSVTDNPIVFTKENKILHGGNFHGQPVAFVMDFLGIAIAELANISERRIARLTDSKLSECLPAFLVEDGGLNSGLMIAQYTAAALVSENKVLAHPSSVDSIPTSANQEDHVSMGTIGARKCREILRNVTNTIAIELMCGFQALEFHRPLESSKGIEAGYKHFRKIISKLVDDRVLYIDIKKIQEMIDSGTLINAVEKTVGKLV